MFLQLAPFNLGKDGFILLAQLRDRLVTRLGINIQLRHIETDPDFAWNARRNQYDTSKLLGLLDKMDGSNPILGVCSVDLYIPIFTFVLGEAHLGGKAALVSTFRLDNATYGLSPDPDLMLDRLEKVALHEFAHLLGLVHCPDSSCLMNAVSSVEEVDLRGDAYCTTCHQFLRQAIEKRK